MTATVGGVSRPVDTGFIVHNPVNFPNIVRLFAHLGVATEASDMSFAVSARDGALEYAGGKGPAGLFAQPTNLFRPSFRRMVADILRFNRLAAADLGIAEDVPLGAWLADKDLGDGFREDHLLPMTATIWSAPADAMLDFPAAALFRFLHAHGLLRVFGRPRWRTVSGGCLTYVDAVIRDFPGNVYSATPVQRVERTPDGVAVFSNAGGKRLYDAVVMATHADISLALLGDADAAERETLGAFSFTANRAVLHRDRAFMPRRRPAWASWNYLTRRDGGFVTYWMNRLQNIDSIDDLFVTLDPPAEPREILADVAYRHPKFDAAAIRAQRDLPDLQGKRGTWFCGAWTGYGFHEDGLRSAIRVAADFDAAPPWDPVEPPGAASPAAVR